MSRKCEGEGCDRPLEPSEERFCPDCANKRDHSFKEKAGIVGAALVVVGLVTWLLTGRKST